MLILKKSIKFIEKSLYKKNFISMKQCLIQSDFGISESDLISDFGISDNMGVSK